MTSKDYHRFMDAPPETNFTTNEIAAAYGVKRNALSNWGLTRVMKIGKVNVYRKADVIRMHGEPPTPRKYTTRVNGHGTHPPALGLENNAELERMVRRVVRREVGLAVAPLIPLMERLVHLQEEQLDAWRPKK